MTKLTACGGYSDKNGNHVIGSFENCNIMFLGKNSTLKIGDNFIAKNMTINVKIKIHKNYQIKVHSLRN